MDRVKKIFGQHPAPASDAGEEAYAVVTAAAECVFTCTACADACLEEPDPAELRHCIRLNQDCADLCEVTARLLARPGRQDRTLLNAQLDACVAACRACAEECQKHAGTMGHCRTCADACRACAEACEAMKGALVA